MTIPKMVMVVMDTMNMDTINGPQMWDPFDAQHPNYDHPQDGHVGYRRRGAVLEVRSCGATHRPPPRDTTNREYY